MAFRSDITVDWISSPRRIVVAAPSTELVMQDLHDTLVRLEDDLINMSHKKIVTSSGKQTLSSDGTKVGITTGLINATIGFEDRPGADWVLCSFLGGNLVAYTDDTFTTQMEPVHAAAFVSIKATSSSSATLQEQDALQYASYGGAVNVNVLSTTSGTDYPSGNVEYPVNNVADAVAIANAKGFRTIKVRGNCTFGAGHDISGFEVIGQSATTSFFTIEEAAVTNKTQFFKCTMAGILDGNAQVEHSVVWDLEYFSGYMHNVGLTDSTINLDGGAAAIILHCYAVTAGNGSPVIDMGGSGQSLTMGNYNGDVTITNKTGVDSVAIYINSGKVIIDSTCINGLIEVYGGEVINNSTGTCVVDHHSSPKAAQISDEVWNKVLP